MRQRAFAYAWLLGVGVLPGPVLAAAPQMPLQPSAQAQVVPLWRKPVVRQGLVRTVIDSQATPAIDLAGKQVICGTGESQIVALDLHNTALRWRYKYTAPIEGQLVLVALEDADNAAKLGASPNRQLAIVGAKDGALLAIDAADGQLVWRTQLDAEVRAAPHAVAGRLYVTTSANQMLALDVRSGRVLWSTGRSPSPGMTVQGHAAALRIGDRVFTSYADGFAVAVDAASGTPLWSRPLSLSGGRFVDADAGPVQAGAHVVFASLTDGLYALDVRDGSPIWQQALRDVSAMTVVPASENQSERIVAADVDGNVWALDGDSGRILWRTSLGATPVVAVQTWQGGVAALAGEQGVWLLDPARGTPISVQALGGHAGGHLASTGNYLAHLSRSGALLFWQGAQALALPKTAPGAKTAKP